MEAGSLTQPPQFRSSLGLQFHWFLHQGLQLGRYKFKIRNRSLHLEEILGPAESSTNNDQT